MKVEINQHTYPGSALKLGDENEYVLNLKIALNEIAVNYPAIPIITPLNPVFNESMEAAVKEFQNIFNLPITGIVDKATWYEIGKIHAAVKRLESLSAIGIAVEEASEDISDIAEVQVLPRVQLIQYFLNVLSAYYNSIPPVDINGMLDHITRISLMEFQKTFGLPVTGSLDEETWDVMYRNVLGIFRDLPPQAVALPSLIYPNVVFSEGSTRPGVLVIQELLAYLSTVVREIPSLAIDGIFGPETTASVKAFQRLYGLEPTGLVDKETWNLMVRVYRDFRYGARRER